LYATHVHGGQVRKETTIPYVAHLLAVAATILEYGGSEDMAIAGLLHDAAEDQGGEARLADIRNRRSHLNRAWLTEVEKIIG
jgi:(p)ppGpp synthase/HD superfamily hydrolase